MDSGLIAKRYATALAGFAAANGEERCVCDEAQRLLDIDRADSPLRKAMLSPILSAAAKQNLLRHLQEGGFCQTLDRFISLVLLHHRERYLRFIWHSYIAIYKQRHGIVDVTVTTPNSVDDKEAERITDIARTRTRCREVRMHRETDESLIGGFVFRMDDTLIDASLSRQLDLLRRQLGNKQNRIV